MSESLEDRHHDATPARLLKARQDGEVAKSFELAAALQMIGAIAAAYFLLRPVGTWLKNLTQATWSGAGTKLAISPAEWTEQIQAHLFSALSPLLPLLAVLVLVGIAAHWIQSGPLFLANKIVPDPNNLVSGNWRRHVFSINSVALVIIGVPKTVIAGVTLVASCYYHQADFFQLANYPVDIMIERMFGLILTISFQVALALAIVSTLDYGVKYVGHRKRLRMSDQQLRDELRMQNGDPQIRARRRLLNR